TGLRQTRDGSGQISRLKMLKRTMYGRASFALLRRRALIAAQSTQSAGEPPIRGRITCHIPVWVERQVTMLLVRAA
ncbi:hypothetical protein RQ832_21025, partial [Roseomonas sp. DSM 102946]|nr:hypothetical protein [Roseomonas sp. DSM 102946]